MRRHGVNHPDAIDLRRIRRQRNLDGDKIRAADGDEKSAVRRRAHGRTIQFLRLAVDGDGSRPFGMCTATPQPSSPRLKAALVIAVASVLICGISPDSPFDSLTCGAAETLTTSLGILVTISVVNRIIGAMHRPALNAMIPVHCKEPRRDV
jgi:hypothetical protein